MTTPHNALEVLENVIQQATAHLAQVGHTIALVLAPSPFVLDAFATGWQRQFDCAPKGDHFACVIIHGAIVLGMDLRKGHPLQGKVTIWADTQFDAPVYDSSDPDDCPHVCPIFKPCPDGDTHPLERAMWDIQMNDWLGYIHPTVMHMLTQEPAMSAEITFQPEQTTP
jgi:hypothetical protein